MKSRLKSLLESRYRISTQLYLGLGGGVAMTVAASLVAWFSFNSVGDAQSQVNESSFPEVVAAFGIAQHSGTLVDAAPRLTTAATIDDVALVSSSIDEARESLEGHLSVLLGVDALRAQQPGTNAVQSGDPSGSEDVSAQKGQDNEAAGSERIRAQLDTLIVNIDEIEDDMYELFSLNARREALRRELERLRISIDDIMVPAVDDQLFYTMMGYESLGAPPAAREDYFSEDELGRYRNLAGLHADAKTANQLLDSAFSISSSPLLEPLRERFESAAGSIERNLSPLTGSALHGEITPLLARLFELGTSEGADNGFDLLEQRLRLIQNQQDLLTLNRGIALDLVGEVDGLVTTARANAQVSTQASTQAILTGRTFLLGITGVSVGGALLIAWLFVGRVLLTRLQMLSNWMLRMAGGDLQTRVEMAGRDEVAEMAAALEVFRRRSLEAQRLNLVEKLADELQGKNDQLESVLADLRKAQDQIVMREKLAALGELTAGVAHEIRNPLNFVKNFSEVSEELITEMQEVLEEGGENPTDDQRSLIQEISGDLTENLGRIRSHGDRANRIVHDMLMMSRGSGDWQPTDINTLLDEHSRLAYHSARATDPNFQLDLQQDLDPEVGEIPVVPQEMGRVFLNMVSNACDATDEKRRSGVKTSEGESYGPTLWIATRRKEEGIEIRIRDNGSGIPPDVIEKIFNPFFTTKPTDRGTGLGLAMSSDIIRQHGGTIRVESEPGEFTEMIINLPKEPPPVAESDDEDGPPVSA